MSKVNQYRMLLVRQVVVLFGILIALLATGIAGEISHQNEQNRLHNQAAQAAKLDHFWEVVAGQAEAGKPVEAALASDLRAQLGPVDPNAKQLPAGIQYFEGNANSYGGITPEIGVDPFDETGRNCFECGPLRASFKVALLKIKQGHLSELLAGSAPRAAASYGFTLAGGPPVVVLLALWLIGGPFILGVAHVWVLSIPRGRYKRFRDLDWGREGDEDDLPKLIIMSLAPTFFVPYRLFSRVHHDEAYDGDALKRKREALDQLRAVHSYAEGIHSKDVKMLLDEICEEVKSLLDRVQHTTPASLLSAAGAIKNRLDNLEVVVKQYTEIQENPRYTTDPEAKKQQGQDALNSFNEYLVKSMKLLEKGQDAQFNAAMQSLEAAQYAPLS